MTQDAMRTEKYNELKKVFTPEEIDAFMAGLAKIRKKTLKSIKKIKKSEKIT